MTLLWSLLLSSHTTVNPPPPLQQRSSASEVEVFCSIALGVLAPLRRHFVQFGAASPAETNGENNTRDHTEGSSGSRVRFETQLPQLYKLQQATTSYNKLLQATKSYML